MLHFDNRKQTAVDQSSESVPEIKVGLKLAYVAYPVSEVGIQLERRNYKDTRVDEPSHQGQTQLVKRSMR